MKRSTSTEIVCYTTSLEKQNITMRNDKSHTINLEK